MQGVYPKNSKYSLPRPYYLKPKKDVKVARNFFTTPKRKLIGYIFFFTVVALLIYTFTPGPQHEDVLYEIEHPTARTNMDGSISGQARPIDDESVDVVSPSKIKGRKGEAPNAGVDAKSDQEELEDAPAAKEFLKAQKELDLQEQKSNKDTDVI